MLTQDQIAQLRKRYQKQWCLGSGLNETMVNETFDLLNIASPLTEAQFIQSIQAISAAQAQRSTQSQPSSSKSAAVCSSSPCDTAGEFCQNLSICNNSPLNNFCAGYYCAKCEDRGDRGAGLAYLFMCLLITCGFTCVLGAQIADNKEESEAVRAMKLITATVSGLVVGGLTAWQIYESVKNDPVTTTSDLVVGAIAGGCATALGTTCCCECVVGAVVCKRSDTNNAHDIEEPTITTSDDYQNSGVAPEIAEKFEKSSHLLQEAANTKQLGL